MFGIARRPSMRFDGARTVGLALALIVAGCGDGTDDGIIVIPGPTPTPAPTASPSPSPTATPSPGRVVVDFDFRTTVAPWQAVVSDYPAQLSTQLAFRSGISPLPPALSGRSGFLLSSRNFSDDVFMGVYRQVDGLRPNTVYRVEAEVALASNYAAGCAGAGGSPGGANFVKAGAGAVLPEPNRTGYVELPVSKGVQGNDGRDLVVIGDLTVPDAQGCGPDEPYRRKVVRTGVNAPLVRSDRSGRLWLIVGTDSGFEGVNTYYVLDGRFTLTLG